MEKYNDILNDLNQELGKTNEIIKKETNYNITQQEKVSLIKEIDDLIKCLKPIIDILENVE